MTSPYKLKSFRPFSRHLNHIFTVLTSIILQSCAQLHHVALSDIDTKETESSRPIEIKVSELGIDFKEASSAAKMLTDRRTQQNIDTVQEVISLFQMGPLTGNRVFTEGYAYKVPLLLQEKCPGGRVTGIASIRETRKYPILSGEIVKIKAFCVGK